MSKATDSLESFAQFGQANVESWRLISLNWAHDICPPFAGKMSIVSFFNLSRTARLKKRWWSDYAAPWSWSIFNPDNTGTTLCIVNQRQESEGAFVRLFRVFNWKIHFIFSYTLTSFQSLLLFISVREKSSCMQVSPICFFRCQFTVDTPRWYGLCILNYHKQEKGLCDLFVLFPRRDIFPFLWIIVSESAFIWSEDSKVTFKRWPSTG